MQDTNQRSARTGQEHADAINLVSHLVFEFELTGSLLRRNRPWVGRSPTLLPTDFKRSTDHLTLFQCSTRSPTSLLASSPDASWNIAAQTQTVSSRTSCVNSHIVFKHCCPQDQHCGFQELLLLQTITAQSGPCTS